MRENEILDRIRACLTEPNRHRLPSIRSLAARFGVSRWAIGKLVMKLGEEGVVSVTPRGGIRKRTEPGDILPAGSGQDRLYEDLQREILSGVFPSGEALPKIAYLAKRERVTDRTVRAVYGRLLAHNLAHRDGRWYIAGPGHGGRSNRSHRGCPAIAIALRSERAWERLCANERTGEFGRVFTDEARRHGVRLIPVLTRDGLRDMSAALGSPQRISEGAIRDLGVPLAGSLIIGRPVSQFPIRRLAEVLHCTGKTVVWFDDNNSGWDVPSPAWLLRCRYSEEEAVGAALEHLAGLGHVSACYTTHYPAETWEEVRMQAFQSVAERRNLPVKVHRATFPSADRFHDATESEQLQSTLAQLHAGAPSALRTVLDSFTADPDRFVSDYEGYRVCDCWHSSPYRGVAAFLTNPRICILESERSLHEEAWRQLLWGSISLAPLFTREATAVIAPSDIKAFRYHRNYLNDLGLQVPRDVSLLSFDNTFRYSLVPISSVDMGFGYLGYQAFHALLGDMPVERGGPNEIVARCGVVNRGSTDAGVPLPHRSR